MLLNIRGLLMWSAAAFVTFQGDLKLPDGPNIVLGKLALGTAVIIWYVCSIFLYYLIY